MVITNGSSLHRISTGGSMKTRSRSRSLITTCRRCHKLICHENPQLWCIQCRWIHRQRGQARGLAKSMRTRRLKAWLKQLSGEQHRQQLIPR